MRHLVLLATLLATASPATAGDPRARKPRARAKGPDVAAALATRDPSRICQVAIDLVAAGDPVRAGLLLPRCPDAVTVGEPLAAATRRARIAVRKLADAQAWSPVELVVRGTGATVTIERYPDVPIEAGALMLPPGTYRFLASTSAGTRDYQLTVAGGKRALVMLEPPAPPPPVYGVVDFGEGEPMAPVVGPPPKVQHGSLLPGRYRRGLCPGPKCPRRAPAGH